MRIAVVGAGGVGGYFGARLARAGNEVALIARGAHLRAIQADGLRVSSPAGDFVARPWKATDDAAAVGPVELVIVAVKAWQMPGALTTMRPLVGPETMVLPLLNGVEAPDQIAAALGPQHALGGLCRIVAFVEGPGHVRHQGYPADVALGELDNRRTPRVERARDVFAEAGVKADIPPDIRAALWEKLLFVEALGAVGAVTRAPSGILRALPETRALLEQAMRETRAVAVARGAAVPESAVAGALRTVDAFPAAAYASMARDIMDGRPSELEAQTGAVARIAGESGVDVPLHRFLYASLLPQERRARGESWP